MNPTVSIIIPTFNYGHFITDALNSVLRQSYLDYEVLVIDDGSTDKTSDIIRDFELRFSGKLTYSYQRNQGVAVSRNRGILNAKGRYIAFIDADDVWLENTLETLVYQIEMRPKCALLYGNVQCVDITTKVVQSVRFDTNSQLKPYSGFCFQKLFIYGNFIPMDASIIRREVFDKVGLFDKRFKCGEDLDMWLRISANFEIDYIDIILTKLRTHSSSLSFSYISGAKADILMTRNLKENISNFTDLVTSDQVSRKLYLAYYRIGIFYILQGRYKTGRRWLKKAWKIDSSMFVNNIILYFILSYLHISDIAKQFRRYLHKMRK